MSVTNTAFTQDGCTFARPELNGHDAVVFNIASHKGLPGKLSWNTSTPTKPTQMYGYFRTSSCAVTGKPLQQGVAGKALSFTFPKSAKWLIVQPLTTVPSKDIAVTVSSPGKTCPRRR